MVLSNTLDPSESLGRYLTDRSYFSRVNNAVKPKAFMPPPNLRLSVFRIDGLTLDEIWAIGQREVIDLTPRVKQLHGLGEIKVSECQKTGLAVDCDNNPPRHANIIGWPAEKEKQKLLAAELAAEANLVLR